MLLKGVRVIDLSQYIPGPYLTRILADLGADVIKIEPPFGDPMRYFGSDNSSLSESYCWLNRGKKVSILDLKTDEGSQKLNELIVRADILIDGFRPGVMPRLGFDQEQLKTLNSRLIYCALTGYGQTGPNAQSAGHDLGYCSMAGVLSSYDNKKPIIFYPPLADHVGAIQASNSILAALYAREKSGQGCFIDASLYEPLLNWNYLVKSDYISQVLGGEVAYYNVYQTADGRFITLSALEKKFWKIFCEMVDKPNWVDRHSDSMPQTGLVAELSDLFKTNTQSYWNELFANADCCYEPVPVMDEITQHLQTRSRNVIGHYPNLIDDQRLTAKSELMEITELKDLNWN